MPEGHTIHRMADDQTRDFSGMQLTVSSPQRRFASGARVLSGRTLVGVEAHGKHLLYDWGDKTLHVHLGLYGKFRYHRSPPPEPRGQVRLRVVGDNKAFDLNGPNACELLTQPKLKKLRDRLGEDPLRSDADPQRAWEKIRRSRAAIGTLLMNQTIIAGVGNIYRSEILHLLAMHPDRKGNTLTKQEFDAMWELTVRLLKIGKRYNRIIITEPKDLGKPRSRMNREESLMIYKKDYCSVCATAVSTWTLAARKVFACPMCQLK